MQTVSREIVRGVLLVVISIGCVSVSEAAESSGSRWWPFGNKAEKAASPVLGAEPVIQQSEARGMPVTTPGAQLPGGAMQAVPPIAAEGYHAAAPVEPAPKDRWMINSPKGKVGWPKLTRPKLPTPGFLASPSKPAADARNSWVQPTPKPAKPSPFKPVADGARKVANGTKKAWRKTVDALTPGEKSPGPTANENNARIASRDTKPPIWKRMFGSEPEPQNQQTIPGFIAQERVDR
ncbi:MAG: hypothetical protein IT425_03515 [Pirellulales bacterium]|nr:hypothetical protein [Pirellulales bacterium]